jgi:transcription elongation factor Elf1
VATETAQRKYTAPCPGCGAPVEFRSAQSTHAVCGYCQSTVVRQGDVLSRIGKMAELFDDHSPLQLFATGSYNKRNFTLIGRLQYKTADGTWAEWNALFDDGESGWLAEDNGAYVFTQPDAVPRTMPPADRYVLGKQVGVNGKPFSVASNVSAVLISAQGELPKLPPLGQAFDVVELRSASGEVVSIDYTATPPVVSQGTAVLLDDLALKGLKADSVKDEKGRQFNCPQCGAPVSVALSTSKSITCGSCNSLIDLSQGIGGELKAAIQDEPIQPLIALGTLGQLQGTKWQVVGFQHRMGFTPGDDEHFGWSEYLLYNQKKGFSFLVDSEEGWSLVRPTTGAPSMTSSNASSVSYMGTNYTLKYSYSAETNYVCGEFYWLVTRGQKTTNKDFANGKRLLSLEQSADELVWSSGDQIASEVVAKAFGLEGKKELLNRGDAAPFSASRSIGIGTIIVVLIVTLILLSLLSRCSSCDPRVENCSSSSSSRSSGGSFGGFSGGGGHK